MLRDHDDGRAPANEVTDHLHDNELLNDHSGPDLHLTSNLEAERRNAYEQRQQEDTETPLPPLVPVLNDLKDGQAFIECLKNASLANERKQLPGFVADRLHSPITGTVGRNHWDYQNET